MSVLKNLRFFVGALCAFICTAPLRAGPPEGLTERLLQARALNIEEIIAAQFSQPEYASGFSVADPYAPQSSDIIARWRQDPASRVEVCALRFADQDRVAYQLRGFQSPQAAAAEGFTVTHQGRCGSCSTLHDLAVYLSTADLTTPARQCARRFGMPGKKRCFENAIGFSPACAESWAYNARQTREECLGTCARDYGFLSLLFGKYPGANVDASGRLRPCLQCDEDNSGPGFKYSAGRTRRNSGIESAIPRPETELYPVDHSAYFH